MPIRFNCRCGENFEVPQELAGTSLQCPKCGLLVDVPLLSDLANIEDDGTLKMGGRPVSSEPGRAKELQKFFGTHKVDEFGREIDLRFVSSEDELAPIELQESDTGPEVLDYDRSAHRGTLFPVGVQSGGYGADAAVPANDAISGEGIAKDAPRYDPITGELIEELELGPVVEPPRYQPDEMPMPSRGISVRKRLAAAQAGEAAGEIPLAGGMSAAAVGAILVGAGGAGAVGGAGGEGGGGRKSEPLGYLPVGTGTGAAAFRQTGAADYPDDYPPVTSLMAIARALMAPHNVFVMVTMAFFSSLHMFMFVPILAGLAFFVWVPFLIWIGQIGHIGNVVEDTGPMEREELPTLFREFGFVQDFWMPFFRVTGAFFLSFGPGALVTVVVSGVLDRMVAVPSPASLAITALTGLGAALFGFVVFPVLLLTLCTSGTQIDLVPARLWGTARAIGARYVPLAVLVGLSTVLYFAQFAAMLASIFRGASAGQKTQFVWTMGFTISVIIAFSYVMHLAAWYMGLTYRQCVDRFPWVFQEHERARREAMLRKAPPPRRRRPKYVQPDPAGPASR